MAKRKANDVKEQPAAEASEPKSVLTLEGLKQDLDQAWGLLRKVARIMEINQGWNIDKDGKVGRGMIAVSACIVVLAITFMFGSWAAEHKDAEWALDGDLVWYEHSTGTLTVSNLTATGAATLPSATITTITGDNGETWVNSTDSEIMETWDDDAVTLGSKIHRSLNAHGSISANDVMQDLWQADNDSDEIITYAGWQYKIIDETTNTEDGAMIATVQVNGTLTTMLTVDASGVTIGHATDTTLSRASAGDINVEGNIVYRAGGTDVPVTDGGTGVGTFTDGGVLLGSGTNAVTAMDALADGSIIVGDGTTDPVALAAFLSSTGALKVEYGGLETTTITDHCVIVGSGNDAATVLTAGADNEVLRGSTGADPAFGALVDADIPDTHTHTAASIDNTEIDVSGNLTSKGTPGTDFWAGCPLVAEPDKYCVFVEDYVQAGYEANDTDNCSRYTETADLGLYLCSVVDSDTDNGEAIVVEDGAGTTGGAVSITPNDVATDLVSIQMNGEPFQMSAGKKFWFWTKFAIEDVDQDIVVVGLSDSDTDLSSLGNDHAAFILDGDGNLDFSVDQDGTATKVDTGFDAVDAGGTLTTNWFCAAFYFDGASDIYVFTSDTMGSSTLTLATNLTDNGTTLVFPDDEEMTYGKCIKAEDAGADKLYMLKTKIVQEL